VAGSIEPMPSWRAGASTEVSPWILTYHGFDPDQQGIREALCTLANGYLGTGAQPPNVRLTRCMTPAPTLPASTTG
jgi:hypothetical protein